MPTEDEFNELLNNTTNTWTTINGVNGILLTSWINGNTLFFPDSGVCGWGTFSNWSNVYWSSIVRGRCSFRTPDKKMEPQDGGIHLYRKKWYLYH